MVELLYFAELKEITGKEKEEFDLTVDNMRELITHLISKYEKIKKLVWDEENARLKGTISIAINHKIRYEKDKLSITLNPEDKVSLLLPVSGG
ncbi:MAG: MoaD family protein [Candidatus Lokiarchaeota archaeon]|nr:MoaD family protein [Candidatus Lokiarchaeota archaeon]MBD3338889.1 MoaD family protein [Candidatus Lokiarchaeota archaeon]